MNDPKRQAGADEIEITPAMIEAGLDALAAFDTRFDREEDAVQHIYRAMHAARPTARRSCRG